MPQNKETSVGIKLVADLRNYNKNLTEAQKQNKRFKQNVKTEMNQVSGSIRQLARGDLTELPGFFKAATASAGGFSKGLQGLKAVLISTGVGAILVLLGTAIGAITQYLIGTEEGQIVFKKVMNNIKAYVEPVLQMFGKFGKALVHLFKGEFGAAWETAKGAIAGVGDQIEANRGQVDALNKAEEEYIKNKRKFLIENKRLESEIAELKLIAEDSENNTANQRQKAIEKAIELQKQLANNRIKLATDELEIEKIKASFGDNTIEVNDQLAELEGVKFEIIKAQNDALKEMVGKQRTINQELTKEIDTRQQIAAQAITRKETAQLTTIENKQFTGSVNTSDLDTTSLENMGGWLDANTEKVKRLREEMEATMSMSEQIDILASSFGALGSAIGGTAGNFLQWAGNMLQLIPQLIAQIVAMTTAQQGEAMASGIAASQKVPFPLNIIALAATVGSIVAAFAKIPKFADGGIVPGSSFFGDKVLARLNSGEEVLTRDDPRHRNNQGTDTNSGFIAKTSIKDNELLILVEQAQTRRAKRTGK